MPYITVKQSPAVHLLTLEEILAGPVDLSKFTIAHHESNTRTYCSTNIPPSLSHVASPETLISLLEQFVADHQALYQQDRSQLYTTFHIPKKSGGLREINAPVPELMHSLRVLKGLLETRFLALYHTSAFAYVPGRCAVDAVRKHQCNQSRWFLKVDFSNFFGSTTLPFLLSMLSQIFPFSSVCETERGRSALEAALDLCFLHGGLPQGTPISPMLTNLMMIPVDYTLFNTLRNFQRQTFVYTRYADDLLISSRYGFHPEAVLSLIQNTLAAFSAPFLIKEEKTRYGSSAGSNWNLGVMLNKDNEITIGHRNKKRFRAMVCSYLLDRQNGTPWSLHDVQVLAGLMSYYAMVEKPYVEKVIGYNNQKYHTDLLAALKEDQKALS